MIKKNKQKEKSKPIICPICGETMKENPYAYDNRQYDKIAYKCDSCGHKCSKLV